MKHNLSFLSSTHRDSRNNEPPGFALIASISVMVLLVMIALAMLSLSTIELRSSRQGDAEAEAQANARMALMIAIGELQKNAGPDQRITAEASILEIPEDTPENSTLLPNRHWVGVWRSDALKGEPKTGATPIIYRNDATSGSVAGSLVDQRAKEGFYNAKKQALTWLVSHKNALDPAVDISKLNDSIRLVGPKSTSETKNDVFRLTSKPLNKAEITGEVWASRIPVSHKGKETGGMAWWVGDEGVKARFNLSNATTGHSKNHPWQVTAQSGINMVEGYENYEAMKNSDIEKVITRHSSDKSLASASLEKAQKARLKNFHDITFSSTGLLTDTFRGGLRRDLSAFLANGSAPNLGTRTGLDTTTAILDSEKLKNISAKFGLLYEWNKIGKNLLPSQGVDPIAPKNLDNGTLWGWNKPSIIANEPGSGIDLSIQDRPPVHPIMIDAGISYGITLSKKGTSNNGTTSYTLNIHYFPRVVLWNPYNIKINPAKYVVKINMPHKFNVKVKVPGQGDQEKKYFEAWHQNYGSGNSPHGPHFSIPATSFEPGEALLFTANAKNAPHGNKFWGDPNSSTAGNLANFELSCKKTPPLTDNFYIKTNQTITINDASLQYATFQVFALQDFDIKQKHFYKLYFYKLYLNKNGGGSIPNIPNIKNDPSKYPPLQYISQTEDGSSGSDAPWFEIPTTASSPLRELQDGPAPTFYRFKWGHRMQWITDTVANQTVKPAPYNTPYLGYNTLANHNMRAGWHVRSPIEVAYRATSSGARYTHGISIDDPYEWDWANPSLYPTPAPVSNNNRVSPFGKPSDYGNQTFPLLDLPTKNNPLLSLGALQHAPLSQFAWHPTYAIGNSLADPRVPRNQSSNFVSPSEWKQIGAHSSSSNWEPIRQAHATPILNNASFLHDLSYEANFTLWDRYFLSTIDDGYALGDELNNPRLTLSQENGSPTLSNLKDFHQAAKHLVIKGAFNVNSTSQKAWEALFASFRSSPDMNITLQDGSTISGNDIYSRFLKPYNIKYTTNTANDKETWKGYRQLTNNQIRSLAKEVVKEVKRRGPFISLADFINRRLVEPPKESGKETEFTKTGLKGTLQAAIDRTKINETLLTSSPIPKTEYEAQSSTNQVKYGSSYPNLTFPVTNGYPSFGPKPDHNHWADSKLVGAPAYLTQADMLQKFGSVLSARSDTFIIRTYGESLDPKGKIRAKAWCEAIVQRTQTPILAGDENLDPNPQIQTHPSAAFGRKFKIISFRWLSANEI